jgi:MFS family permease
MSVVAAYRRLLGNRALVRLLAGEFVSSVGDWLYLVALLVVVYTRTSSPALLGLVGAARVLPYIVLSVPAGIVADRYDRRLVLMSTDIARGILMLGLAALVAFDGPLPAIVVLAIAAACFSAFFGPAIGAFLPSLVRDESQLGPANSAWATLDNLAFVLGPAIGGFLIAASGLALAFLLNAVSFGIVAAVLWSLPRDTRLRAGASDEVPVSQPEAAGSASPTIQAGAGMGPLPDGVGHLRTRPVAGLLVIDVAAGFAFGGLAVLTVILATDVLQAGDAATGYLNAAIGIGGIAGATASGALVLRPNLAPPMLAGAVLLGVGLAALGATRELSVGLAAMAVASAGSLLIEVVSTTIFQRAVPDAYRGRVRGATETVTMIAYSTGSFAAPVIASAWGVTPLLAASGIVIVLAAVVGLVLVGDASRAPAIEHGAQVARFAVLPVFAGLPPSRLQDAMRRAKVASVSPGQVVIRQGERADRFYVIARGVFHVTQRDDAGGDERHLRDMGPDEVFGEIGLLTGVPRTATVTSAGDGQLLTLDGPDFLELVGSGPGLTSRLLDLHRGAAVARG